jgi:hypothetical protein
MTTGRLPCPRHTDLIGEPPSLAHCGRGRLATERVDRPSYGVVLVVARSSTFRAARETGKWEERRAIYASQETKRMTKPV